MEANIETAEIAKKNSKYSLTISIIALVITALVPVLNKILDNYEKNKTTQNTHSQIIENNIMGDTITRNKINKDSTSYAVSIK